MSAECQQRTHALHKELFIGGSNAASTMRSGELRPKHGLDVREPFLEPLHIYGETKPTREPDGVGKRFLNVAVERGRAARRAGIVHPVVCGFRKFLKLTQMGLVRHARIHSFE